MLNQGKPTASAVVITELRMAPTSLVTREEPAQQRMNMQLHASCDAHLWVTIVRGGGEPIAQGLRIGVRGGRNELPVMLPVAREEQRARLTVHDGQGNVCGACEFLWGPPREWTLYVIRASHTDIGLHNSQYIQRSNCSRFLDQAMKLCDQTETWPEAGCYRYVVEGSWFWENYCADRGTEAARTAVSKYVHAGKIAVGGATAGNHTQVYGSEEMCRSAYTRSRLGQEWGIETRTLTMIDNNGLSWALVAPYVDAGFRNVVFAPNQWNPLPSTIWPRDHDILGATWNPDASGGGARIDVRYDSALPLVFYWRGADERSDLLVWCSTGYDWGGCPFGLRTDIENTPQSRAALEERTARQLIKLEERYPYDAWLFACYGDDEEPNLKVNEVLRAWNQKWRWPEYRAVGDLDEPFERLRRDFHDQIPVLSGDITGGWYQHPLSTPELLAQKFAVDRLLPTAEKLATLAGLFAPGYRYPAAAFRRAWDALICNDEHSYGTSGYQGRRVYETWMQHRDWIDKAERTAKEEAARALAAIAGRIEAPEPSLVLFNPTLSKRREIIDLADGDGRHVRFLSPEIPAFGYVVAPRSGILPVPSVSVEHPALPPVIENRFYRITFATDGSLVSVFDKDLHRELLDVVARFRGNQFVYTADNHQSFHSPQAAVFRVERDSLAITVIAVMDDPVSGAAIEQRVALPSHEKRIDIDNQLRHVTDVINRARYHRYGYYAFPFAVPDARARVNLNGCIASPGIDQTGHGTDTYLAGREWCCVENGDFGVALIQLDSHLVEFGEIHPDKTDCHRPRDGSAVFSYLFNDWLQMHTPGGSHVNPRFRYTIVSYGGDFRQGGVPQLGERAGHPVQGCFVPRQSGTLPGGGLSFLESGCAQLRLLALKRAEDGDGVVMRLHETHGTPVCDAALRQSIMDNPSAIPCSIDEQAKPGSFAWDQVTISKHGYLTLRLRGLNLAAGSETVPAGTDGTPAAIGAVETGLITEPRAACGEHQGHLYLIWGQNMETDLSHYELYRGEQSGFPPQTDTLVAMVEPGPYRVARYEDRDLKTHTIYYYRVRAVNRTGRCSEFSTEFCGVTRE